MPLNKDTERHLNTYELNATEMNLLGWYINNFFFLSLEEWISWNVDNKIHKESVDMCRQNLAH